MFNYRAYIPCIVPLLCAPPTQTININNSCREVQNQIKRNIGEKRETSLKVKQPPTIRNKTYRTLAIPQ